MTAWWPGAYPKASGHPTWRWGGLGDEVLYPGEAHETSGSCPASDHTRRCLKERSKTWNKYEQS